MNVRAFALTCATIATTLAAVPCGAAMIQKTRVMTYVPAIPSGPARRGSCWTRSIAASGRADAWRCMLDNEIYDPCFTAQAKPGLIVCDVRPPLMRGFAVRLTKPLPVEPTPVREASRPWLVELDGLYCHPQTGTHALIGKNGIAYECRSRGSRASPIESGLIDGSIRPGSVWTARLIQYRITDGKQMGRVATVALRTVWQ